MQQKWFPWIFISKRFLLFVIELSKYINNEKEENSKIKKITWALDTMDLFSIQEFLRKEESFYMLIK